MLQNIYKTILKFKLHEITPPKANPGVHVVVGTTSKTITDRAMVHLNQGVRHHAKACVALVR
jgi:hypothetical protein